MVMSKESVSDYESNYWVMAKITEPKYEAESRWVAAERLIIEHKLAHHRRWFKTASSPKLGVFSREDWHEYAHELDRYEHKLAAYAQSVKDRGVLPVKFAVYNNSDQTDRTIRIKVDVHYGRVDTKKTPPARPTRIDAQPAHAKLSLPRIVDDFRRRDIRIKPHTIEAEFSKLGPHDGATLINQLVHVHCGPETRVRFEIRSDNVAHESGDVEI